MTATLIAALCVGLAWGQEPASEPDEPRDESVDPTGLPSVETTREIEELRDRVSQLESELEDRRQDQTTTREELRLVEQILARGSILLDDREPMGMRIASAQTLAALEDRRVLPILRAAARASIVPTDDPRLARSLRHHS